MVLQDPLIEPDTVLTNIRQNTGLDRVAVKQLLNRTGLTWGNLSSHLNRLEEAGYVSIEKTFRGKKPWTMIRLSSGRAAAARTKA